jgi:hypothetical protein
MEADKMADVLERSSAQGPTCNAHQKPLGNSTGARAQTQQAANSTKTCSIVFIGAEGFSAPNSYLRHFPAEQLPTDYELFFVDPSPTHNSPQYPDSIKASIKIIKLTPGLEFEQLCMEAAKQAQGKYVLFANAPTTKEQVITAVRQLESTGINIAAAPEKNYIIVKRRPLLQTCGFKQLLRKYEQLESVVSDFERQNKPLTWDTTSTQNADFGHILKISDRIFMLRLMPKNSVVAEIGVFKGQFSAEILDITKPSQLHLVDLWPNKPIQSGGQMLNCYDAYQSVQHRFKNEIEQNKVVLHRELSAYASQEFENEYFDWIYIDAGHHYEAVKTDLACWYPKVKTGGLITGHDYTEKPQHGVFQAVNEFLHRYPAVFVALTQEAHGPPSWILKKMGSTAR